MSENKWFMFTLKDYDYIYSYGKAKIQQNIISSVDVKTWDA